MTGVVMDAQPPQWTEPPFEAFRRDADGRWRTEIVKADGSTKDYVVPLLSAIEPEIRVSIARTGSDAKVVYRYPVTNGPAALQSVGRMFFEVTQPLTVAQAPPGWRLDAAGRPELMPEAPASVSVLQGVPAGGAVDFTVVGPVLSGVGRVRLSGDTLDGVAVPDGLSDRQRAELERLVVLESLTTSRTVAPVIPAGRGESELTRAIVLSRIVLSYRTALHEAGHEYGREIEAALDEAIRAEGSEPELEKAMQAARDWAVGSRRARWGTVGSDAEGVGVAVWVV